MSRARSLADGSTGLAAQVLSSLTNFAVQISVLRVTDTDRFGRFALAYLSLNLLAELVKSGWIEGSMASAEATSTHDFRGLLGGATIASFGAGAMVFAIALVIGAPVPVLLALAAVAVSVEQVLRMRAFSVRKPGIALAANVAWLACQAPVLALQLTGADVATSHAIAAWVVGGTVASGVAMSRLGLPTFARSAVAPRSPTYAVEVAFERGAMVGANMLVGLIAGPAVIGAIQAARVAIGPVNVAIGSAGALLLPALARLHAEGRSSVRWLVATSVGLAALPLSVAAVFLLLPDDARAEVLGSSAAEVSAVLLLLVAAGVSVGGVRMTLRLRARVLGIDAEALRARVVSSLALLVGGAVGALVGSPEAAAWGMLASGLVGVVAMVLLTVPPALRPAAERASSAGAAP